ncbi:unnamed protein product [Gordionus sp. m RMFG-2023]
MEDFNEKNVAMTIKMTKLNVNAKPFVPTYAGKPILENNIENAPDDWESMDQDKNIIRSVLKEDNGAGGGGVNLINHFEEDMADIKINSNVASVNNDNHSDGDYIESHVNLAADELNDFKKPLKSNLHDEIYKENVNIVFIGHVDAGKSTIGGQLMNLTGAIDKRTLEKYEREAKEKSRENWYLSWALDTNQEERDKGKTVEVGRAYFETPTKKFVILDAPGHKCYVPNMISGTTQADIAVLVISARKGEFETGFEKGGQTQEHAMLAKTIGVRHLIVLINKMDDPTVKWDHERYKECKEKLLPFLKKVGFNPKTDLHFMPVSGLQGTFLKYLPDKSCPALAWYSGPSFLDYLETFPPFQRMFDGPLRIPIIDRYRDMGTLVLGKIESGTVYKGQTIYLMPNKNLVEVLQMWSDEVEIKKAVNGENIKLKLKGVEEEDVCPGFVLCDILHPCRTGKLFDVQIVILELKSIICPGFSAILHVHTLIEEVTVKILICLIDKKTGQKGAIRPRFVKQDQAAIIRLESIGTICLETFKDFPRMGRITLRDEGLDK